MKESCCQCVERPEKTGRSQDSGRLHEEAQEEGMRVTGEKKKDKVSRPVLAR